MRQEERKTQSPYNDANSAETSLFCVMPMRKDTPSKYSSPRYRSYGLPTPTASAKNRERARVRCPRPPARQRACVEPKRHGLGSAMRLNGLAAPMVISRCCSSSCWLPGPVHTNAESALETTVWPPGRHGVTPTTSPSLSTLPGAPGVPRRGLGEARWGTDSVARSSDNNG